MKPPRVPFDAIDNPAPDDAEPVSSPELMAGATLKDIRNASAAVEAKLKKSKRQMSWGGIVLAVAASIGSVAGGWQFVISEARAAADAGVAVVKAKQELVVAEASRQAAELHAFRQRVEKKLERQDEKQDLILDALRVPMWKRPAADGGT